MRSLWIGLFISASALVAAGPGARAEPADTRIAAMPFDECLAIIAEAAEEMGEEPVILVGSDDLRTVRINASDGFVTVSCSRPDNKMTLTKSPVPAAAGMTAER